MKRCPSCSFPNKDTDRTCFKCNALLDPDTMLEPVSTTPPPLSSTNPMQFFAKTSKRSTLSTKKNVSATSPTPQPTTLPTPEPTPELLEAPTTEEVAATLTTETFTPYTHVVSSPDISLAEVPASDELLSQPTTAVPPISTPEPKLLKAARILPKYKSFQAIKTMLIVIGCLQTLSILSVGISTLLYIQAYIGLTAFINVAIIGTLIIVISCIVACTTLAFSLLSWANDTECNQRKQLELLNHLYHK